MDIEMKEVGPPPKRRRSESILRVLGEDRKLAPYYGRRRFSYKKKSKAKRQAVTWDRPLANKIHTLQSSVFLQLLTSASPSGIGYTFSVSNLTNFAAYRAIWEEYRFDRVTVMASQTQTDPAVQAAAFYMPTFYVAVDPNDGAAPASLDEVLQTGRWRCIQLKEPTIIADFVPTSLWEVQASAGVTTTSVVKRKWISLENVAMQHNGLKLWFDPTITGNNGINITVTYTVSFRSGK